MLRSGRPVRQKKRNDRDLKQKPFLIPLDEEERALRHRDRLGARGLKDSFQSYSLCVDKSIRCWRVAHGG
jgi:hypothetical protein